MNAHNISNKEEKKQKMYAFIVQWLNNIIVSILQQARTPKNKLLLGIYMDMEEE